MSDIKHNLLTDALLSIEGDAEAREAATLPGVLARLGARVNTEFNGLRSHQRHGWHAFLVQLAAIATHRAGDAGCDLDEAAWRNRLMALTDGAPEPWCLVVPDLKKPAFLQPPVPEGKLERFQRVFDRPDELDVVITAKNHDLKGSRIARPSPEHWLFALVTLQTTEGFLGRGNYGVARMNGGFASRPQVGASPAPTIASRFTRDVSSWREAREGLRKTFGYADAGVALLWSEPWDGTKSLSVSKLDPFFLEVCRRVRATEDRGRLVVRGCPTECARVDAKKLEGVTGDIWIPVHREGAGKALTVSRRGFDYSLLTALIFPTDYAPAAAQTLRDEDGDAPCFVARVLARGQGETNGLHERVIEIPPTVRDLFAAPDARARLGAVAVRRVEQAGAVRSKALRPALIALLQADPRKAKLDDKRVDPFTQRFDARIDERFFPRLWSDVHCDDTEADRRWLKVIVDEAREVLDRAIRSAPLPSERRYRAEAAARRIFEGSARNNFAPAFAAAPTPTSTPTAQTPGATNP